MLRSLLSLILALSAPNLALAEGMFRVTLDSPILFANETTPIVLDWSLPPLDSLRLGDEIDATISIVGGSAPYTFSVTEGTLPEGIVLGADGTLSGQWLGGTNGFTITIVDAHGRTGDFVLGAVHPVSHMTIANVASVGGYSMSDVVALSFPSFQGGTPPYTMALDGDLPSTATFNAVTGRLVFTSVPPGEYGPFRFMVTDGNDEVVHSNPFTVSMLRTSGMRLTLPGGHRTTFVGWTAAPLNIRDYYLHPNGNLSLRMDCGPSGTASYGGQLLTTANSMSTGGSNTSGCLGSTTRTEFFLQTTGQSIPVVIANKVAGTMPSNAMTYTPSQVTWTHIHLD